MPTLLGIARSVKSNLVTETNKLNNLKKKFWQNINLNSEVKLGYIHIQMDYKTFRTPIRDQLRVKEDQLLLAYPMKNGWNNFERLLSK